MYRGPKFQLGVIVDLSVIYTILISHREFFNQIDAILQWLPAIEIT